MTAVTLEEAQARLAELVAQLRPGEELVITQHDQAVARLVGERTLPLPPRKPGNCRDMLRIMAEDDEHLKDFTEYVP